MIAFLRAGGILARGGTAMREDMETGPDHVLVGLLLLVVVLAVLLAASW